MTERDTVNHLQKAILVSSSLMLVEGFAYAADFNQFNPGAFAQSFLDAVVFEPITDAIRGGTSEINCNKKPAKNELTSFSGLLSYIDGKTGPVGFARCQTKEWLRWQHFEDRFEAVVSSSNPNLVFEFIVTTESSEAEGFEYRYLFRASPQDRLISARWDRDFAAVKRGEILENKPFPFSDCCEKFKLAFQITRGSQNQAVRTQKSKIPFSLLVKKAPGM